VVATFFQQRVTERQDSKNMIVKVKNKLKEVTINYAYLLGDWVNMFNKDFLGSFYMNNLMSFLYILYKEKQDIMRPRQVQIFKPFLACRYSDVKVILMTEFPSATLKGNGIGLGNNDTSTSEYMLTPQLKQMKTCIENTCYSGVSLSFDNTLKEWGDQGVLCLNSALTGTSLKHDAHKDEWEVFMKQFITQVSDKNSNLIFAFVGEACKFAQYVNTEHHVVVEEKEGIEEAIDKKEIWMSDMFNEINDELFYLSGDKSNMIDW